MSEPTNPLFEEEKEFLERKKLEYERALRGDVEHIKEQTVHVGKLALVGAGVAGGIWLLTKAFGRRKPKRQEWHYNEQDDDDYSGFGDDSYDYDADENAPTWNANRYFDQEPHGYSEQVDSEDEDEYPTPSLADEDDPLDDNGLSESPDFEPHSSRQHGTDDEAEEEQAPANAPHMEVYHTDAEDNTTFAQPAESRRFQSEDYSHPTANLPYDDSRRMPESNSFTAAEPTEETSTSQEDISTPAPKAKKSLVGPAIMSFLQSDTGKVIAGQVAAVAMALVTKAVKDLLPSSADETTKSSDLAASKAAVGSLPYGQQAPKVAPQSPVLDAHDPDASTAPSPLA
ncbi:hypothetical protein GO988_07405 [Hymenobacter sp. HMF4947]|uniref:Uncharacterized protein n=1 Tax=Hymenobacter ginkgonis TaxID=2682976 RepID=A0A7K1TCL5_9BACT|nr:hypothetical protein [Hymenobacter ginkgonis]MVN76148.1 hypothetical protein [Hymenobacter ginkgonis]